MKKFKRLLPAVLVCGFLLTAITPIYAGSEPTEKEEVIYVNLGADGGVKEIYAVNIFDGGEITDYGDYSSVEMLNTTDKISQNGDKVSFSSKADRVYYKGKTKNSEIPWNISLKYFIDGKEYSASDAAGKSGKLEIRFKVKKNENCKGNFFDKYALQASFTLNTEKCENISATGATIANVGAEKQLTYTCLPGKGIDAVITADVKGFEMPAVSINGISMSMNIEVDDSELLKEVNELTDAVKELYSGAGELKDGADKLHDGGKALEDGTGELKNGAEELSGGAQSLNSGILLIQNGLVELNGKSSDLTGGSEEIQNALLEIQKQLSAVSASSDEIDALVNGSAEIKKGINSLSENILKLQNAVSFAAYKAAMKQYNLDIDALQTSNEQMIGQLTQQIIAMKQVGADTTELESILTLIKGNSAAIIGMESYLDGVNANIGELYKGVEDLKKSYKVLDDGINAMASEVKNLLVKMTALKGGIGTLVTDYGKLDTGINEYTAGVAQIVVGYREIADGSGELLTGSKSLYSGAETLYAKTGELIDGISKLSDGTYELKNGTSEMKEKTDGMDGKISDKIDEMLKSITGGNEQTVSFVSEKNTNIKSVQFVIQTDGVEIDNTKTVAPAAEEKLNFWQKLLRLFGLY